MNYPQIEIGPQPKSGSMFSKRMRFHQSWYRTNILKAPYGVGPNKNSNSYNGSMLDKNSGDMGLNFLNADIFDVALNRINRTAGIVERHRLLYNMLSSQPMCFNLFGALVSDLNLATNVFKTILPQEVDRVTDVIFEYAPEPISEYLDDLTAFDAFVQYDRMDGSKGFVGIETKLTEPFSQRQYIKDTYNKLTNRPGSQWNDNACLNLAKPRYNQLWRDHLLTVAILSHKSSVYTNGYFMLVRHQNDKQCSKIAEEYRGFLKPDNNSFIDCPLCLLLDILDAKSKKGWIMAFRSRYLDLHLSEQEFIAHANNSKQI